MFQIKPTIDYKVVCPFCHSLDIENHNILFGGTHVLVKCLCVKCRRGFYNDLPLGNSQFEPLVISDETKEEIGDYYCGWNKDIFIETFAENNSDDFELKVIGKCFGNAVIIINCLDVIFGHVLLRLFNYLKYEERTEFDIVVIIKKNMEWLVPNVVSEIWLCDISFSNMYKWNSLLNKRFQEEIRRFDLVYMAEVDPHPVIEKKQISKFVGIDTFNLEKSYNSDVIVTYIFRTDRSWLSSQHWILLIKIIRRIFPNSIAENIENKLEKRNIEILSNYLSDEFDMFKLCITGIGEKQIWNSRNIIDYRKTNPSKKDECDWCTIYSNSNIVIGMHGSHMLLPSLLGGGVIEIMPFSRLGNFLQDLLFDCNDRLSFFVNRIIYEFIPPRNMFRLIKSIITDLQQFRVQMLDEYKVDIAGSKKSDLWALAMKKNNVEG